MNLKDIAQKYLHYRFLVFAVMVIFTAQWIAFKVDLCDNYVHYASGFPEMRFLQNLQERLDGSVNALQLYIISAGIPFALFLFLVLIPETLKELFPRYRVWNSGYIVFSAFAILGITWRTPAITKRYHNSEYIVEHLKAMPKQYLKHITVQTVDLTMLFWGLILVFSLVLLITRILRKKPQEFIPSIRRGGITLLCCLVFAFLYLVASAFLLNILDNYDRNAVAYVSRHCTQNATIPMATFVCLVCAPIMEEITFRGVICRLFHKVSHGWVAIILSAVAFGLWHRNLGQFVYTFTWGVALGYLYLVTGRVIYPMLVHFLGNLFAVFAYSETSDAVLGTYSVFPSIRRWLQEWSVGSSVLFLFVVVGAIALLSRYIKKLYNG